MVGIVRRMGRDLRDHRLPGVRARFALFVAFTLVMTTPFVLFADRPPEVRALALGGVAWLFASRVSELKRARLAAWPADLLDAGAFLLLGLLPGPEPVVGVLFSCIQFRALFVAGRRVPASVLLYALSFAGAGLLSPFGEPFSTGDVVVYLAAALVTGYLMNALRTSIVAHEEAVRVEHAAVVDNERFLSAVLDNLSDGVMACAPDGRLTVVNRAARKLHGLEPASGDPWGRVNGPSAGAHGRLSNVAEAPLRRALAGERVSDAELTVHLTDGERRVVMANGQPIGDRSHDGDRRLGAVVTLHDITDRRVAEEALTHQALHDALTGLPNRSLLMDRVVHALSRQARRPAPLCLVFVDIDHFKQVNDLFGHAAGDRLLRIVGDRISAVLRPDDTPCRLGGDEFAVLLEDTSEDQAVEVAERLRTVLSEPVTIEGRTWTVRASLGVAEAAPGTAAGMLLRCADLAMYAAKGSGRDRVARFTPQLYDAALAEVELEAQLRVALDRGEMFVAYQPIVETATGAVVGAEALLRWQHPERGVVCPSDFIGVAESSGLIESIGRWVLFEACREARRLMSLVPDGRPFLVSVNLSPRQVGQAGLVSDVRRALEESGLDPSALALEVTESALMDEEGPAKAVLAELAELGVTLSLDDFGTGYSSLARLHSFPFKIVKIDRAFVSHLDEGNASVVDTVLSLARDLGLDAVAEGVETERELAELAERECRYVQGFLFSQPVSAQDFARLLVARLDTGDWAESG